MVAPTEQTHLDQQLANQKVQQQEQTMEPTPQPPAQTWGSTGGFGGFGGWGGMGFMPPQMPMGGFMGGLFGGRPQAPPPPPQEGRGPWGTEQDPRLPQNQRGMMGGLFGSGYQNQQAQQQMDFGSMMSMFGFGGSPSDMNREDGGNSKSPLLDKSGKGEQTVKIQVEAPMNGQQPMPPQQGQPPAPYPQPPQGGPASPYQPTQPPPAVPPATPAAPPADPNLGGVNPVNPGAGVGGPPQPPTPGDVNLWNPNEKNQYGDQTIAGADPSQADYDSVQGYADQSYEQAMKRLDPQHQEQNNRMQQELVNKGIDPNSPQGQKMMDDLSRQQGDQLNSATFESLKFGQGIQNQMAQQEQQKAQLAGNMQQALWQNQLGASGQGLQKYMADQGNQLGWGQLGSQHELGMAGLNMQGKVANMQNQLGMRGQDLQRYGMDQNFNLGRAGQDLQRYGMDQNYQLGQSGQDIQRQNNEWNQMMGGQDRDFQYQQYNDMLSRGDQRYNDQMLMSLLGFNKPGGASQINPMGFGQALLGSAGQDKGWLGSLFGGG